MFVGQHWDHAISFFFFAAKARDSFLACLFLEGSNKQRYYSMVRQLESDYVLDDDTKCPESVEEALEILNLMGIRLPIVLRIKTERRRMAPPSQRKVRTSSVGPDRLCSEIVTSGRTLIGSKECVGLSNCVGRAGVTFMVKLV